METWFRRATERQVSPAVVVYERAPDEGADCTAGDRLRLVPPMVQRVLPMIDATT